MERLATVHSVVAAQSSLVVDDGLAPFRLPGIVGWLVGLFLLLLYDSQGVG